MRAKDDVKKRTMEVDDERKCPSGVHATKMGPEDFQLHVQSDHSTGGHWCAKIFFFTLLVILLGLICLIIMENRGLDDLDRPLSESRYAEILEGWIDDDLDAHDNHNGKNQIYDKGIIYHDQHKDEQENHSEEENLFENELDIKIDENEIEDETEDETEDQTKDELENNKDDHSISVEFEDDDGGLSEEIDLPHDSYSIERKTLNLTEIEIDDDPLEHEMVEENEVDEVDEVDELDKHEMEDEPTETSPLAVRIIVGLALVIVAHQVLLKRPRTNDDNAVQYQDSETIRENVEIIGMKRRLTLVTAEEPIQLNEDDMIEHPPIIIEDIPATEDNEFLMAPNPSNDGQIEGTPSEEEPLENDPISEEIAINEEKDLGSEEEILSSEDIYSDEEINDYESSEISDIDDSDLLKRLDEKYGKIPQHSGTIDIDNDPTWTKIDHAGPSVAVANNSYVKSDPTPDQLS